MPSQQITDYQVRRYTDERRKGATQLVAAARAGLSERSGRGYEMVMATRTQDDFFASPATVSCQSFSDPSSHNPFLLVVVGLIAVIVPRTSWNPFAKFTITPVTPPRSIFLRPWPSDFSIGGQVKVLVTAISKKACADLHIRQPSIKFSQLTLPRWLLVSRLHRIATHHFINCHIQVGDL
jgi:hypothetical protein